jgi:GNAT superfamily N-acetyltransferase
MVELAQMIDLDQIDELAIAVINDMNQNHIPQWTKEYPRKPHFLKDITQKQLYIIKSKDKVLGVAVITKEDDEPYKTIHTWKKKHSLVIHRMLVDPSAQGKGVASMIMMYAKQKAMDEGYQSIKIDTHPENFKMRMFLIKHEFIEIDYLSVINRIAYEWIVGGKNE